MEIVKNDSQTSSNPVTKESDERQINSKRVKAFDMAIERYMSSIFGNSGFENALARSFKPVYKTDETSFKNIAAEIGKSVKEEVKQQIENEVTKLEIRKKLFELDGIEKDSDKNHVAWRPSLPEKDTKAHLYEAKRKHLLEHKQDVEQRYELLKKELNEQFHEYQKQKDMLSKTIQNNEESIETFQKQIKSLEDIVPLDMPI